MQDNAPQLPVSVSFMRETKTCGYNIGWNQEEIFDAIAQTQKNLNDLAKWLGGQFLTDKTKQLNEVQKTISGIATTLSNIDGQAQNSTTLINTMQAELQKTIHSVSDLNNSTLITSLNELSTNIAKLSGFVNNQTTTYQEQSGVLNGLIAKTNDQANFAFAMMRNASDYIKNETNKYLQEAREKQSSNDRLTTGLLIYTAVTSTAATIGLLVHYVPKIYRSWCGEPNPRNHEYSRADQQEMQPIEKK